MEPDFVNKRITELRLKKDISEYKMSMDIGHHKGYINQIACGRSLPSVPELLYICEYLNVTPSEFFDEDAQNPILLHEAYDIMKTLGEEDMQAVLGILHRLKSRNQE